MPFTNRMSDGAIVATIDPEAYTTAATVTTDVFDMSVHHEVLFILMLGTVAANTTVDLDIQESTATAAGTVTATAVASITQLTAGDDDTQVLVSVRGEDMSDGYRYLRGVLTIGGVGGTVDLSLAALADQARYKPANAGDLASVDEIVNA